MALNLTQKQEVVAELAEVAAKAHSLVAAEYAGTTVEQMTAMRKKARETGVYLRVVKNTLASRAVAGTDYECVQDALVGPLLYAFSTEEPGAAGRLIKEFAKGNDKLVAKVMILMDLSLPGMDGWEATRVLKSDERTKHIPVVALTGHALAGASEGARKAGCDSFVTKPCLPDDLVVEVRRMLDTVKKA